MKCINIYTVISQHLDNRTKYINSTLTKIKEISDDLKINIGFFSVSQPNPEYIKQFLTSDLEKTHSQNII